MLKVERGKQAFTQCLVPGPARLAFSRGNRCCCVADGGDQDTRENWKKLTSWPVIGWCGLQWPREAGPIERRKKVDRVDVITDGGGVCMFTVHTYRSGLCWDRLTWPIAGVFNFTVSFHETVAWSTGRESFGVDSPQWLFGLLGWGKTSELPYKNACTVSVFCTRWIENRSRSRIRGAVQDAILRMKVSIFAMAFLLLISRGVFNCHCSKIHAGIAAARFSSAQFKQSADVRYTATPATVSGMK